MFLLYINNIFKYNKKMSYIIRKKRGNNFVYPNALSNDLDRIKKLCIPPQWDKVEISKNSSEKIQAIGYDSKGRKQYIYHPAWISFSKNEKFDTMKNFCYKKYKNIIDSGITKKDLSKDCVICNMLKIMEDLNIRVGNEVYLNENNSVGLTTLMKKHLTGKILSFKGKKGIHHTKEIIDKETINFIKRVTHLRGKFLFYYLPDNKTVTSQDLNSFLKEKVQKGITCKDIRTYSANVLFVKFMNNLKIPSSEKERKRNILQGLKYTADQLGNTPKVCRDAYISPENILKFT